ncbi:hypothetical protein [Streptococcus pseudopneumoniae]|jgi:hypothetical protein|uniref:hypothetical protein n=1 Tax=Streptococcus pseudopneumoniae TaxID=257758 RepID=UPI00066AC714|nr:hypothetical protein [Streptococcus pseudopneumoniae]
MGKINKTRGIIKVDLQYGNGNIDFHKNVSDAMDTESYDHQTYLDYLDKIENLREIIGVDKPLMAVKHDHDYLIVTGLSGPDKEISVFIVWQSPKELADLFPGAIKRINDFIKEKWEDEHLLKAKRLKFDIPSPAVITIYPAYKNGYKVESGDDSVIQNISIKRDYGAKPVEILLNILGILIAIGILITTFNWDTFWGLVIPMGIVVSYNIFEWTQKSYQLIVKSFDTIENPNNIKESTSATDIEFKLPEMINIKGEEEENV